MALRVTPELAGPVGAAARDVPSATRAVIGGSGSLAADLPGDLHPDARVLERGLVFETPWGESPPFTLFALGGHDVLHVAMHGWRKGVSRGRASRQVFSVLHRAGVRRILSDAGVGSLNHLLDPGDLVVVDDFVDTTTDRDRYGVVVGGHLLVMRDPACPTEREALVAAARRLAPERRVFVRGTYVVTEGPRFESPAEIRRLQPLGDVVGQSFSPEVWLASDIGACYAGIYLVVNYGEGVVKEWEHDVLARMFRADAPLMGRILLEALAALPDDDECQCRELRKPTLLGLSLSHPDSAQASTEMRVEQRVQRDARPDRARPLVDPGERETERRQREEHVELQVGEAEDRRLRRAPPRPIPTSRRSRETESRGRTSPRRWAPSARRARQRARSRPPNAGTPTRCPAAAG